MHVFSPVLCVMSGRRIKGVMGQDTLLCAAPEALDSVAWSPSLGPCLFSPSLGPFLLVLFSQFPSLGFYFLIPISWSPSLPSPGEAAGREQEEAAAQAELPPHSLDPKKGIRQRTTGSLLVHGGLSSHLLLQLQVQPKQTQKLRDVLLAQPNFPPQAGHVHPASLGSGVWSG